VLDPSAITHKGEKNSRSFVKAIFLSQHYGGRPCNKSVRGGGAGTTGRADTFHLVAVKGSCFLPRKRKRESEGRLHCFSLCSRKISRGNCGILNGGGVLMNSNRYGRNKRYARDAGGRFPLVDRTARRKEGKWRLEALSTCGSVVQGRGGGGIRVFRVV